MLKEKLENWARGRIELFWVDKGEWTSFHVQENMVVNGAADIMAMAVSGKRAINGMYMAFENDPSAVNYTPGEANDAAYYATPSTDRGLVRVSTLGEPVSESTDPAYVGNKVTFMGVTDGTSFFPSVTLQDGTSVLYHSALTSMVEGGSQDEDKIFSCADFTTPVTKIAGSQLGVRWDIIFARP